MTTLKRAVVRVLRDRALPPQHQGSAFACIDPSGVGPRLFFQCVPEEAWNE
jgi:hypothetical protein